MLTLKKFHLKAKNPPKKITGEVSAYPQNVEENEQDEETLQHEERLEIRIDTEGSAHVVEDS